MIKHIVCFKLKDGSRENCEKAAGVLRSMSDHIDYIRALEVGVDFLRSERSYDLILQVTLDDTDALDRYQSDPYHVSVVKKHMHAVRESSVAVDYYLD